MNQPNEQRWTDAEMADALTAQHLITSEAPNSDRWERSRHEDVREWAASCLGLQGAERLTETEQAAARQRFTAAVNRILTDAIEGGRHRKWLREQLAFLEDKHS